MKETLKDKVKHLLETELTARDSDTYLTREIYHQLLMEMGGYPSGVYGSRPARARMFFRNDYLTPEEVQALVEHSEPRQQFAASFTNTASNYSDNPLPFEP